MKQRDLVYLEQIIDLLDLAKLTNYNYKSNLKPVNNKMVCKRQAVPAGAALGYFIGNIRNTESVQDEWFGQQELETDRSETQKLNQRQDMVEKQNKAIKAMISLQRRAVTHQIDSLQNVLFSIPHLTVLVGDVFTRMDITGNYWSSNYMIGN